MSVLMRRENTLIIEPGSDISKIQIINFILLPNSKKHFEGPPLYIPFVIGVLRIVGGVYFVINIDSALGQNASYGDVFFYFELLCTVLAVVFCAQAFISMFADYKSVKIEAVKEKKERKTDEFMTQ
ncbi:Hypothetical_protein [Hexamita inflata]|uniref:Hypothetical_protein n=1 Tax=Hexamita inflata TaxID=28002 RepID=A0AA86PM39_9EUKA|nr:Hypothetical protein HINF_LOCUS25164 [Hexamita inflata]